MREAGGRDKKECERCRFVGCQKFGKSVCALTGGDCKHDAAAAALPPLTARAAEVLDLWAHVQTQWRVVPMGGLMGLDYGGVAAVAKILGYELGPEELGFLQALEAEWLQATK